MKNCVSSGLSSPYLAFIAAFCASVSFSALLNGEPGSECTMINKSSSITNSVSTAIPSRFNKYFAIFVTSVIPPFPPLPARGIVFRKSTTSPFKPARRPFPIRRAAFSYHPDG